jgi:hypothetical protein
VLPKLRDNALAAIERAEARVTEIDAMFASGGFDEKTTQTQT